MSNNVSDQNINLPPPNGNPTQAEKYVNQLIKLLDDDKLTVFHTDLSKFNPGILQDHFRMDLNDYQIEISHSKDPNSAKDSYIILFNNLKKIAEKNCQKVILAYMHLEHDQFMRFRKIAFEQIERMRRMAEEKRLKTALKPVDEILESLEDKSKEDIHPKPENLPENPLQTFMAVS